MANRRHKGYSPHRVTFPLIAGSLQIGIIILFALYGRYDPETVMPAKSGFDETNQPSNEYPSNFPLNFPELLINF